MAAPNEVAITCEDGIDFSEAIRRAQLSVSPETRAMFVEFFKGCVVRHGYAWACNRIHGRLISELVKEAAAEQMTPIEKGDLNNKHYELYEAPGKE